MKKYAIYAQVSGSKYLGEVEAESENEAIEKGYDLDSCSVSICHQCAREVDDAQITEITADLII